MKQYIDKDALVAEIKRKIHNIDYEGLSDRNIGQKQSLYHILSFINTLEVKEVDFIKEFYAFSEKHKLMDKDIEFSDIEKTASFFFQLGLSVNSSITAADRGTAEEIIINLKRVEQDYRIDLTKEIKWVKNQAQKGE